MNHRVVFRFAFLLAVPSMAADFTCPGSVAVQQAAKNVPAGWEATESADPSPLDRVALYQNHPKEAGSLVPDKTEKQKGEERVTWTFVRTPAAEIWLGCVYTGTTVILARKLSPDVSKCEVRYDLLPSGRRLRVKAISCL